MDTRARTRATRLYLLSISIPTPIPVLKSKSIYSVLVSLSVEGEVTPLVMRRGATLQEQEDGIIYARYSSHAQKDASIEQQIRECMAFALSLIHI